MGSASSNASAAQGLNDFGTGFAQGFLGTVSSFTGGMIPSGASSTASASGGGQTQMSQVITLPTPVAPTLYAPTATSYQLTGTSTSATTQTVLIAGGALVLVLLLTN